MKLFDAHCHPPDFPDIGKIMERNNAAGVDRMAVCLDFSKGWKPASEFFQGLEKVPQIVPMVGIHPWFVSEGWKESFQCLEKMIRKVPTIGKEKEAAMLWLGIGETGLDFSDQFENRTEQEACFAAHLDLARELNLPVAVHCVQAWGRLIEMLREHPAQRILLHGFGGAPELIHELMDLNCWFSFGGMVLNPKARKVRASIVAVSAERLLVETDSDTFSDESVRLMEIVSAVAALRGVDEEAIASLTFSNAMRFFDLFD